MTNAARAAWDHGLHVPDRVPIRGADAPWTGGALRRHAAAVAGRLRAAGIARGDRVLWAAPSGPAFAGAYYGINAAGAGGGLREPAPGRVGWRGHAGRDHAGR